MIEFDYETEDGRLLTVSGYFEPGSPGDFWEPPSSDCFEPSEIVDEDGKPVQIGSLSDEEIEGIVEAGCEAASE